MSAPSPAALIAGIISQAAAAVSGGSGLTPQQRDARVQNAAEMMRHFEPRSVIEAMLAAHCVLFHKLLIDALEAAAHQSPTLIPKPVLPAGFVALNNAFHRNLTSFQRVRKTSAAAAEPNPRESVADTNRATAATTAPTTPPPTKPAVSPLPAAARPSPAPATAITPKQPPSAMASRRASGSAPA
jgi:hypothetical protein